MIGVWDYEFQFPLHRDPRCNRTLSDASLLKLRFSSLYIGILAATVEKTGCFCFFHVSVPFTSGSSLQQIYSYCDTVKAIEECFSSLYIGILAATRYGRLVAAPGRLFQFPLHRDPRCNGPDGRWMACNIHVSVPFTSGSSLQPPKGPRGRFPFGVSVPFTSGSSLQRIPRSIPAIPTGVSVPFTSGSSLQPAPLAASVSASAFQFPLHRDPRCNISKNLRHLLFYLLHVSVPFTSGSSLQQVSSCSIQSF